MLVQLVGCGVLGQPWWYWSRCLLCVACWGVLMPAWAAPVTVVTSVRPLQWMAQALLPPEVTVVSLVPPGQSMHEYRLRPADLSTVQQAAVLVWSGPGMEPWLVQLASRLPPERVLALLPTTAEADHDHAGVLHEQLSTSLAADAHFWLDPVDMIGFADVLAAELIIALPEQATAIRQRLPVFQQALSRLDSMATQAFAPVQHQGFVVYHDSYGRLVSRYHLNQQATVWHHEAIPAGARERAALLSKLRAGQVSCVFHEPEYGQDAVTGWLSPAATGVRVQKLDPLGSVVQGSGVAAYSQFFETLVNNMVGCLSGTAHRKAAE